MQFSAEANAFFTMVGFSWLVGPMDMKKVEVQHQGRSQVWNSGVQIKKCRYLEQSGCVGMCVNMCKVAPLSLPNPRWKRSYEDALHAPRSSCSVYQRWALVT